MNFIFDPSERVSNLTLEQVWMLRLFEHNTVNATDFFQVSLMEVDDFNSHTTRSV